MHLYDLSALVDCWVSATIRMFINKFLNVCSFGYTAFVVNRTVEYP